MNRATKSRTIPIEKVKIYSIKNSNFIIYSEKGSRLSGVRSTSYKVVTLLYTLSRGMIYDLRKIYVYDTRNKININSLEFINMYSLRDSKFINKGIDKIELECRRLTNKKRKCKRKIINLRKEGKTDTEEYIELMKENSELKIQIKSSKEHLSKMDKRLFFIKKVVFNYRKENVV